MNKRISPKRYLYDNGVLILKSKDNDSINKLNEAFLEQNSRNNNKNNIIDFPILSQKNNNNKNNYKIFTTEIEEEIQTENKKEKLYKFFRRKKS